MVTYWSLGALRWQRIAPWIWCMVVSHDIYLSVCLSSCLSFRLSICISICLAIYQSIHLSSYLPICLSLYRSIYQSFFISIYLFIYLSFYLSISPYVCLSIELYLSASYLPIFLSINLYICNVMIYSSAYVYLDNSIGNGIIEMLFDHDWLEILLQKKHLNQRERTCCLNLNWWNNLNLIVTLSNFWDALPSLVNT